MNAETLLSAFGPLAPWPAGGDLSDQEWDRYLAAAREVQAAQPGEVEPALLEFLDGGGEETSLFLLLRVVFDLPERAPVEERRTWKGWVNWPEPDPDGTVNLSWPVRWDGSRPALQAAFEGAEGPRYAAIEEYRDLRERFAPRALADAS